MAETGTTSEPFGEEIDLTGRIRELVRNYPRGLGIFKEFIQNADDARATRINFVIDWRSQKDLILPKPSMSILAGPALLVYNDQAFRPEDLKAIRRIGGGSKATSGGQTGRFGHGFRTCYNLTDFPSFLTGSVLCCFDPQRQAIADPGTEGGLQWKLATLWDQFPDFPSLFLEGGVPVGTDSFNGVVFRLPFRDRAQAKNSSICNVPVTKADIEALVQEVGRLGPELLLFVRHVVELQIVEINSRGNKRLRVSISTTNVDEIERARAHWRAEMDGDPAQILEHWKTRTGGMPMGAYTHNFDVSVDGSKHHETWRVIAGLVRGPHNALLNAASEMSRYHQKALPQVGAAVRLTASGGIMPVEGRYYCTLPLPLQANLPIHVNGYFDLDDSRQHLTVDQPNHDPAASARAKWNTALTIHGIARAWARLIEDLAGSFPSDYYHLWPNGERAGGPLHQVLTNAVFSSLSERKVMTIRKGGKVELCNPAELQLLPVNWRDRLSPVLEAEGEAVPDPPLPEFVETGLRPYLRRWTPQLMAARFRTDIDLDSLLEEAPQPALRQRRWLIDLVKFCGSDSAANLKGLPLGLCVNGKLRTLGVVPLWFVSDEEQWLLSPCVANFIDSSFAQEAEMKPQGDLKLYQMSPTTVLQTVSNLIGTKDVQPWKPQGGAIPHAGWLARLMIYLSKQPSKSFDTAKLKELPLVPGSDGRLYKSGLSNTPLDLAPDEESAVLRRALTTLKIPILDDSHEAVLSALTQLKSMKIHLAMSPSGPNLVKILRGALEDRLVKLADEELDAILDWITSKTAQLSRSDIESARSLPIFPTAERRVSLAGNPRVFTPAGFDFPHFAVGTLLLRGTERWGTLYRHLGVPELDERVFLEQVVLSALESDTYVSRAPALVWLRENLFSILGRLPSKDLSAVRARVANARIFPDQHGNLLAISELTDPEVKLFEQVFGEAAPVPSSTIINQQKQLWLGFLRELGLRKTPHPEDLLAHIDRLTPSGLSAEAGLRNILTYIEKNREALKDVKVRNGSKIDSFNAALARRAWMSPLLNSDDRSPRGAFREPEHRLFCPSELGYDPGLVGSQSAVCAWKIEKAAARWLGMIIEPPLGQVLAHLESLLDGWEEADASNGTAVFQKAVQHVYEHLNSVFDPKHSTGHPSPRLTPDVEGRLRKLSARACIWDPASSALWQPANVFICVVPDFTPLRVCIGEGLYAHFLTKLGCRTEVQTSDRIAFLDDLAATKAGLPLDSLELGRALRVLGVLADDSSAHPHVLVSSDARLCPPSELFWDDATWWSSDLPDVPRVDSRIKPSLLARLEVRRLSEHVTERLVDAPPSFSDSSDAELAESLHARLQSSRLQEGIDRLFEAEHGPDSRLRGAPWQALTLKPCIHVRVDLMLDKDVKFLGREVPHHYDAGSMTWLFAVSNERRIIPRLAALIQRLLAERNGKSLQNLAPLEHILACRPDEVHEVLDEDRIPRFQFCELLPSPIGAVDPASPAPDTPDGAQFEFVDTENVFAAELPAVVEHDESATLTARGTLAGSKGVEVRNEAYTSRFTTDLVSHLGPGPRIEGTAPFSISGGNDPMAAVGIRVHAGDDIESVEVEEAALQAVMSYELSQGRYPRRLARGTPGHDVVSRGGDGALLRVIEVKGLSADWRDRAVLLTETQLAMAWHHRALYWLYIVERLKGQPRMYRIQDPVSKLDTFEVRADWARFHEAAPRDVVPRVGQKLVGAGGLIGTILKVDTFGKTHFIEIDGLDEPVVYKPSIHRVE